MSIPSLIQGIASTANVLSAVVLAVGYPFMIGLYHGWVRQNGKSRETVGLPMVAGRHRGHAQRS